MEQRILKTIKQSIELTYNQEELLKQFLENYIENCYDKDSEDEISLIAMSMALCETEHFKNL